MDARERALLKRLHAAAAAKRPSKRYLATKKRSQELLRALEASRKLDPELMKRPMTI